MKMKLNCSIDPADSLEVFEDYEQVGVVFEIFNYNGEIDEVESTLVNLSKLQIEELHKGLEKYLRNNL